MSGFNCFAFSVAAATTTVGKPCSLVGAWAPTSAATPIGHVPTPGLLPGKGPPAWAWSLQAGIQEQICSPNPLGEAETAIARPSQALACCLLCATEILL